MFYTLQSMALIRADQLQQLAAINLLFDPGAIGGPIIVPSAVQCHIVWTLTNGKTARNVLYGIVAAAFAPTPTIAEAIRAGLTTGANWTALAAFLSTTGSLSSVQLRDVRGANFPLVPSTGAAVPGTSASPALPDEVAACITLRTSRTGPGGRGRTYIPNFATNALGTGGVIAPTAVTAITGFANLISTVLTTNGLQWALGLPARAAYTGSTGTAHPARVATALPLTAAVCRDNHWDSQRRRGLK